MALLRSLWTLLLLLTSLLLLAHYVSSSTTTSANNTSSKEGEGGDDDGDDSVQESDFDDIVTDGEDDGDYDADDDNSKSADVLRSSTSAQSGRPNKGKKSSNKLSSDYGSAGSTRLLYNAKKRGMHQLMKYIFANYDKELMPTRPVLVKLDVLLLKVKSTVEKEGIFESVIALFIEWSDYRMMWDPADYDNVTVLAFDSEKVWLPDIAMTNSADHLYGISRDTRFVVRVTNDGLFKFVPTGTAKTWCELNLLTFPFDMQTCSLEFESWSLDSSTMAFRDGASIIVDNNFLSSQWSLCRKNATVYNVIYEFSGETFSRVKFDFTVRRKSTFYMINLVFPCATLSAIQLLVFAIPSMDCSSDRIGFGTTNLLTLVVFQTIVTEEMPKTSDAVTALSKYIIALIILSAVGIFESVCVERMRRITFEAPPRQIIRFARILPLLWRRKSTIDYPSILIAAGCGVAEEDEISIGSSKPVTNTNNVSTTHAETPDTPSYSLNVNNNNKTQFQFVAGKEPSPTVGPALAMGEEIPFIEQGTSNSPSMIFNNPPPPPLPPVVHPVTLVAPPPPPPSTKHHHFRISTLLRTPSGTAASIRQRKMSRFTAAKEHRARRDFIESQYAELWGEIATRLDVLTFIICAVSVCAVPLILFLPLLYFGDDCLADPQGK